jgi:hypothetical protein
MTAPRRTLALASALLPLSLALATPAWASTTANEIVYVADADNDGVYSVVLQDLETRRVTTLLPANVNQGFTYDDPELSPDGSRVVLSSDYQGSAATAPADWPGITIINRDGTGFRRLTSPPAPADGEAFDTFPAWSPDGSTIVFTRLLNNADGTSTSTLLTVPAAGGAETAVPGGAGGFTADFNPKDGSEIVFAAPTDLNTGVGPLQVMKTDGTGKRALGATGALPAWSPDGGTIAYAAITDNDTSTTDADIAQIATVPAAGGAGTVFPVTRPTSARSVAEYPSWSPDGESILYDFYTYDGSGNELPGDLWAVDRSGVRAGKFLGGTGDEAQVFAQGPPPAAVQPGAASRYTPVNPKRILDTRSGIGAARAKVGAGQTIDLQVAGVTTDGGQVPANATAAVLNVTVTNTTGTTDVRVFPSGTARPGSSNLNAGKSQTVPNLVTATLGANGKVSIYNSGGTVDLIADLGGWYTPGTSGAGFTAVDPRRILDTRPAPDGPVGPSGGPVRAGAPIDVQVTGTVPTAGGGSVSIPADATAVVLNVTATSATTFTDVRVYPTPSDASAAPPVVSNLNLGRGQITPNLVTVAVGAGGKVRFRNASGSVQLLADIAGYYSATTGSSYVPVAPLRFLDTRSGIGAAPILITNAAYDDLKVAGTRGVPAGAVAAVLNLTATSVSNLSDVRAYPKPTDNSVPVVSNLNPAKGATRANLAIVKPGDDGRVRLRVAGGSLHLSGDLAGYFQ